MSCSTCRWWRRLDPDSDAGVCRSVHDNDYASAYLDADGRGEGDPDLVTYDDHHCSDYEAGEDADGD